MPLRMINTVHASIVYETGAWVAPKLAHVGSLWVVD